MIPEAVATREPEEKGQNGDRELFSVRSRYCTSCTNMAITKIQMDNYAMF
jgi:hypothetical protein